MSRRPYVRPIPKTTWYLAKKRDMLHMTQEVSCVFIGIYAFLLLLGVRALSRGPETYQAYLDGLAGPGWMWFQRVAAVFIFYHTISWFSLTPKAMPVQIGEEFLPGKFIVGGHYAAWAVFSLVVLFVSGVFSGG